MRPRGAGLPPRRRIARAARARSCARPARAASAPAARGEAEPVARRDVPRPRPRHLGDRARGRGDDRQPGGHRLGEHHAELLLPGPHRQAREHHARGARVDARASRRRATNARSSTAVADARARAAYAAARRSSRAARRRSARARRPAAADHAGAQRRDRAHHVLVALLPHEPAGREDRRDGSSGRRAAAPPKRSRSTPGADDPDRARPRRPRASSAAPRALGRGEEEVRRASSTCAAVRPRARRCGTRRRNGSVSQTVSTSLKPRRGLQPRGLHRVPVAELLGVDDVGAAPARSRGRGSGRPAARPSRSPRRPGGQHVAQRARARRRAGRTPPVSNPAASVRRYADVVTVAQQLPRAQLPRVRLVPAHDERRAACRVGRSDGRASLQSPPCGSGSTRGRRRRCRRAAAATCASCCARSGAARQRATSWSLYAREPCGTRRSPAASTWRPVGARDPLWHRRARARRAPASATSFLRHQHVRALSSLPAHARRSPSSTTSSPSTRALDAPRGAARAR